MRIRTALVARLKQIPEGEISEVARRARVSIRQLQRMRVGEHVDVRLSTLERLVDVLGITGDQLLGGAGPRERRPAPIGRRRGRPRNARRWPDLEIVPDHDEDQAEDDVEV